MQPKHPKDDATNTINEAQGNTVNGQQFFTPVGSESNKVIVGQVHGHGSPNAAPRVSGNDTKTAKTLGVPVYAVDKKNIHKVSQAGNKQKLSKTDPILRDALETSGGLK